MKLYLAGENYKTQILLNDYLFSGNLLADSTLVGGGQDNLKLFLVGEHETKNGKSAISEGVYILESYVYARDNKHIQNLIPTFKGFLLDSGAYTFMIQAQKKKVNIDWNKYIRDYAAFINKFNVDCFFELDIDRIVGIKEVERLRDELEILTNKKCMPVWHRSRGLEYWRTMCRNYDYISLSASGNNGSSEWTRKPDGARAMWHLLNIARENNCRVHGLGYTRLPMLKRLRFYSVDSTAWLMGNRGGFVYQFTGDDIIKHFVPARMRLRAKETAIHNFKEWVKFQQYADQNL